MAWIQVHQQLKDHRKVLAAADELEIDPAHMLGLIISFWLWALDNAPNGTLEGINNRMIARAAQWSGSPDVFVETMTHAGLLDEEQPGVLTIHDWYEYTGKLIDQREAERDRARRRRAASSGQYADSTRTVQGTSAGRVDQSRVDQSRVDKSRVEHNGDTPSNPPEEKGPDIQERRFAEFWQQYPKKVGKKAALNSWKKLKPNTELFERIMQAVTTAKNSDQWRRENGRYIPNPATWINQGRWDDELTVNGAGYRPQGNNTGRADTMGVLSDIIAREEGGGPF